MYRILRSKSEVCKFNVCCFINTTLPRAIFGYFRLYGNFPYVHSMFCRSMDNNTACYKTLVELESHIHMFQ